MQVIKFTENPTVKVKIAPGDLYSKQLGLTKERSRRNRNPIFTLSCFLSHALEYLSVHQHRPECQGCRRMPLPCVYPAAVLPDPQTVPSAPTVKVCLDHLRVFHHFLAEGYPPHPYGASAVWQDVAALSHQVSHAANLATDAVSDSNPQYDFLASSILALAAQHLTVSNKGDYSVQALNLRISAIRGLNDALSLPCHTAAYADARYAAIIGLTFQSTYMPDGLDGVHSNDAWMDAHLDYSTLLEMVFYYALTNKMTDEDYASFTDPSNYGAQILLAHFLVLNHMLEECFLSTTGRRFPFSEQITRSWILNIGTCLPDGLQRYIMWPLGQARDLSY
ncbi:C6 transcription factor [Fusarium agapanthi]|uniref:C6 transcription factor n=1 Tax=Fusarium agapanthi TaxID=1803897 RepID=A0A9P5E939_9HYPO|nr:C6 transcription factor [Fusarium agapanthi]